jgi:hypothetical protein
MPVAILRDQVASAAGSNFVFRSFTAIGRKYATQLSPPIPVEQSAVPFQLLLSSQSIFFGENSRATNRLQISVADGNIHSFYILMT